MSKIQCRNCGKTIDDNQKKCPYCKLPLSSPGTASSKKGSFAAIIVGAVIMFVIIIFLTQSSLTNKKIVFKGTSTEFCSEFRNEIAAHEKYKKGIIEVSGKVSCTGRAIVGGNFVALQEGTLMPIVYCYFGNKYAGDLAEIRKGDEVIIRGEYGIKALNNVTLSNSKFNHQKMFTTEDTKTAIKHLWPHLSWNFDRYSREKS